MSSAAIKPLVLLLLLGGVLYPRIAWPQAEPLPKIVPVTKSEILWRELRPGLEETRIPVFRPNAVLQSELEVLRIDPRYFSIEIAAASDMSAVRTDLKTMTRRIGGVFGINTSFFDENGAPLGLVIRDGRLIAKMHQGGSALTGVFYTDATGAHITHRSSFGEAWSLNEKKVINAFQAGPRLIADGEPIKLSAADAPTRRSGVATTRNNRVLLFVTVVRFPGATLEEIQLTLLNAPLEVRDALNLDGGGSSQLFIEGANGDDIFISGGDLVPLGLIGRRLAAAKTQ